MLHEKDLVVEPIENYKNSRQAGLPKFVFLRNSTFRRIITFFEKSKLRYSFVRISKINFYFSDLQSLCQTIRRKTLAS